MKRIEAIIRPGKVSDVCKELAKIGHPGIMLTDISGHGRQRGMTKTLRGKVYNVEFITKTKMDLIVKDSEVEKTLEVIRKAAYTGEVGDGKIFVSSMEDALRIRTAERGESAV
ncbi:MAG: P-II family nitrogen regulator [Candidatus Omnitrophica bacterium]|nr:P-II family nitrogen regulator [Candidatus Omnitrophota bacterium]